MTEEALETPRISDPSGRDAGFLPLTANPPSESGFDYVATPAVGSDFGLNLISETTNGTTTQYVFGPSIDEPLAVYASGAVSYLNADGLGSIVATNTPAGTVSHNSIFDAWGVVKSETGTRIHSFTYTGREVGEAGLHFYRSRLVDAFTGRLSQEDPVRDGGISYAYASSDPVDLIDPTGLAGEPPAFNPDGGHHPMPRQLWANEPDLAPGVRRIFDMRTGGPLPPDIHGWSPAHVAYNNAVKELFQDFLQGKGKTAAELTEAEAEEFVKIILRSERPEIAGFLGPIRRYLARLGARIPKVGNIRCGIDPISLALAVLDLLLESDQQLRNDYQMHMFLLGRGSPPTEPDL